MIDRGPAGTEPGTISGREDATTIDDFRPGDDRDIQDRDDRRHDEHKHDEHKHESIAALFRSEEEARQAIKQLHKAHFTHTWFGLTSMADAGGGEQTLTVDSPGLFSLDAKPLVDALVAHGVHGDEAREIESSIQDGEAIVTVEPRDNDAGEAMGILRSCGGRSAGGSGAFSNGDYDSDLTIQPETFYRRRASV